MRSLMLKSGKAVVLVTVFLMLVSGGCYTKLKHPRPVLYADGAGVCKSDRAWDFSYGWYGSHLEVYPEAYSYYYLQWWDDYCWRDGGYFVEPDNNDEYAYGKIVRRDDIYIPHGPALYDFPNGPDQGQIDVAPPTGRQYNQPQPIQPKVIDKTDNKNKTNKITHRGRR